MVQMDGKLTLVLKVVNDENLMVRYLLRRYNRISVFLLRFITEKKIGGFHMRQFEVQQSVQM